MPKDVEPHFRRSDVVCYETPTYSGNRGLVMLLAHAIEFVQSLDEHHLISDIVITPVEKGYDWTLTIYVERVGNETPAS
jgi:hypothetical protein